MVNRRPESQLTLSQDTAIKDTAIKGTAIKGTAEITAGLRLELFLHLRVDPRLTVLRFYRWRPKKDSSIDANLDVETSFLP